MDVHISTQDFAVILELRLSKAEESKVKKIEIQARLIDGKQEKLIKS
jgi:hypothetical protein